MDMTSLNSVLTGISGQAALLAAIGLGTLLAVVGALRPFAEKSVAAERMAGGRRGPSLSAPVSPKMGGHVPNGIASALIPENENERRQVAHALARAGFLHKNAVTGFYLVRVALGFGLPAIFGALLYLSQTFLAPGWLVGYLGGMPSINILQHIAVLCGIGFFGPAYWLKSRIKKRQQAIEEAFPNMLDLLQVGVEAGMGFDQALLKVATEIQVAASELAEEMLVLLSEIQAGRDRDSALLRMARRTGIDEISSFVNVVLQSARFGTSMSDALTAYAEDMREAREMKAQEKANKLPVQMSAVLAILMLPSIIGLILAPIAIRYMATFG
jgi:tight adherence protein C